MSIVPDEDYSAQELIIRKHDFIVKETIAEIVDDLIEEDSVDIISKANEMNINLPELPSTSLKSFTQFISINKDATYEKNSIKKKIPFPNNIPLSSDTLLLTFTFYHPVHKFRTQEWLLTEHQTLEDLHKSIQCLANFCSFGQESEKVAFSFKDFRTKNLKTRINELNLEVGVLYTYLHRTMCQHDMVVSDIRLINRKDPQCEEHYPFQTFSCKIKRRTCEICDRFHAKFIVMKDQVLAVPYIYMCENCLESLNSSSSEVYPYLYD